MTLEQTPSWTEGIEQVVANDLRFKAMLDIGEEAYTSLRLKRYLLDAVDAGNGAITGAAIAKSSFVASTFFAPSGLLGALGIGTAVTPLGWAIAAGALGAGLSVIIGKKFVRGNSARVKVIPEFINTPLDLLAVGLFDMIATLGLKIASATGSVETAERAVIERYFIDQWGYDPAFVAAGLDKISSELEQHSLQDVALKLADYKKNNPDCNYKSMSTEILRFLDLVIAAGDTTEEQQQARNQVQAIFNTGSTLNLGTKIGTLAQNVADGGKRGVNLVGRGAKGVGNTLSGALSAIKVPGRKDKKDTPPE